MRFSLAQLLWLPFWTAILTSLWRLIGFAACEPKPLHQHVSQMLITSAIMFTVAGLGAWYRRPKIGAALGVVAAVFTVLCLAPLYC